MLQLSINAVTLEPRKFMVLVPFTRELLTHSVPNLEQVIRVTLTESVLLARDNALLDDTSGDATRPPGLGWYRCAERVRKCGSQ